VISFFIKAFHTSEKIKKTRMIPNPRLKNLLIFSIVNFEKSLNINDNFHTHSSHCDFDLAQDVVTGPLSEI